VERRVVVTGIGVVTPIGTGRRAFWEGLLAGRSGFGPVGSFDTGRHPAHVGAEVRNFTPGPYLQTLAPGKLGRASQMAVAAARLALEDAGLAPGELAPESTGVSMGTTSGEPLEVERLDDHLLAGEPEKVGGEFVERYPCHTIAAAIAAELGCEGPVTMIPTACAAGNYAIAHAFDTLRRDGRGRGGEEVMLAGGADAFSRITYTGFARLGAIAPELCQPFDRNRKGMIPGEGAGVLVLEPLDKARARGARIYAEVAGYGLSCDAHHMTAAHPDGEGAARAMERALAMSRLSCEEVSYVSAHGTGTPTNDRLESLAVARVFGERSRRVPVSSVKSMLGHTMGAASALEAAVCALACAEDVAPPTMHFSEPDPECDLDVVPNEPRPMRVSVAMNNAYAFGGNNASLILRKWEG
jgi:3-oxoacyl-[acyl-carrier-protein] synthase II